MTTIVDVARAAGVSTATVSRVLNGNERVDRDTARHVRQVVDRLGYRPSRGARALRTQHVKVWALIIPDVRNPFFTEMVRAIEDVAYGAGYSVILCDTDDDTVKEHAYLELALAERVAGMILAPTRPSPSSVGAVLAHGVSLVSVDRRLRGFDVDHALVDNVAGAEQAVEHLLERGFSRLACIAGPQDTSTGRDRLAGFRRALQRGGLRADPCLERIGDFREPGGRREMKRLLALRRPPDAVLVANNMMTLGALEAVAAAGLEIPRDVAIVGFDDPPWNALLRPPLTSVAQPTYELGLETARLLLRRVQGFDGPAREVVLPPELRVRASTDRGLDDRAPALSTLASDPAHARARALAARGRARR
jgi:LacI family transcriptional regulator